MYDFAIIGGGIVGLSTGAALGKKYPNAQILVLEKEDSWAKHQTGHNSGVFILVFTIHLEASRLSLHVKEVNLWFHFVKNMELNMIYVEK